MIKTPELNDLIGKPFSLEESRGPDSYDCWGLCIEVMRRYGITLPELPVCGEDFSKTNSIFEKEIASGVWVELIEPKPPCIVAFKFHKLFVTHVGVYIGNGKIIHVNRDTNTCVGKLSNYSKKTIQGYYRYAE